MDMQELGQVGRLQDDVLARDAIEAECTAEVIGMPLAEAHDELRRHALRQRTDEREA